MRRGSSLILITLITILVSGCGFHLKGTGEMGALNVKRIQVVAGKGVRPDVQLALKSMIKQSGIELVDRLEAAEMQVVLQPSLYRATRTAFSGLGDTTAEYLVMKQGFTATSVATEQVLVTAVAETSRDRQVLTSALLASQRELVSIQREMAQTLALQILGMIQRASLTELNTEGVAVDRSTVETQTEAQIDTQKRTQVE